MKRSNNNLIRAYLEGREAAEKDEETGDLSDCPYLPGSQECLDWNDGYRSRFCGE